MIVLMLILTPIVLLVPALRMVAGIILLLMGLFAWVSHWAARSV